MLSGRYFLLYWHEWGELVLLYIEVRFQSHFRITNIIFTNLLMNLINCFHLFIPEILLCSEAVIFIITS